MFTIKKVTIEITYLYVFVYLLSISLYHFKIAIFAFQISNAYKKHCEKKQQTNQFDKLVTKQTLIIRHSTPY